MVEGIAFQVRSLRDRLDGRPVTWLCDRTGINEDRMRRIISRGLMPSASELIVIARAFGVEPGDLMGEPERVSIEKRGRGRPRKQIAA